MRHLGYEKFFVAGHDRGARTARRMCLDHPAIRGSCEDDRACATCDLAMDKEDFRRGHRAEAPLLVV